MIGIEHHSQSTVPLGNPDWGAASTAFDEIRAFMNGRDLSLANEAQTRYDVIDRMIREVLGWTYGQVIVEEPSHGVSEGYVDYILRAGDVTIVIEAKKAGASFPSPTQRKKLKLSGSVLGMGAIADALRQVDEYAHTKQAQLAMVTNGLCWCFYSTINRHICFY